MAPREDHDGAKTESITPPALRRPSGIKLELVPLERSGGVS